MNKSEMVKWLQNLKEDIGQSQHQDLWHYAEMLDEVMSAIDTNEGEWIKRSSVGNWECSLCGGSVIVTEQKIAAYNYCPNCGKKMRLK